MREPYTPKLQESTLKGKPNNKGPWPRWVWVVMAFASCVGRRPNRQLMNTDIEETVTKHKRGEPYRASPELKDP
jgi:hypothetical protein